MKKIFAEYLQNADKLFKERNYKQVISLIDGLDLDCLAAEDKAYGNLLYCHACLYTGQTSIQDRLEHAMEYYRKSTDNEKFARVKYLHGWYLEILGAFLPARESLTEAYAAYKRIDDFRGQGSVLNSMAYISLKLGDSRGAIAYLKKGIEIYQSNHDQQSVVQLSNNLGLTSYIVGRLQDSISIYKSIETAVTKRISIINLWNNYAIPLALKGDIAKAKQILAKAEPYLDEFTRDKAIYYENLGWIHLLAEEYDKALPTLQEGLKISLEIAPESDLVSQIKRRMADAYFGLEQYNKARQLADEALIVSKKLNERVEIASCYRVFAQLDAIEGKDDSARDWFKQTIDIFAMIESNYDLATCRYIAATSGLYHNGERQALLYLARDYFASEEVIPFVEKIDKHLPRLNPVSVQSTNEANRLIAASPKMKKAVEMADNLARSQMSILLTGATGTGKDMLARYIHDCSEVKGQFVDINISAIPNEMVEAELFGHRKGAYTGADSDRIGLIEQAAEGTLFLNEIADASPAMQAKLLAVIENHRLRRLGENEERKVSFRLLTATNANLAEMVSEGKFRADLYHRIKNVEINLPPLCERPEDIPALIEHFCKLNSLAIDEKDSVAHPQSVFGQGWTQGPHEVPAFNQLVEALSARDWPGNVRELKAEIERLVVMYDRNIAAMAEAVCANHSSEREQLAELLHRHDWNRAKVAGTLGITEGGVRYRMRKYNL